MMKSHSSPVSVEIMVGLLDAALPKKTDHHKLLGVCRATCHRWKSGERMTGENAERAHYKLYYISQLLNRAENPWPFAGVSNWTSEARLELLLKTIAEMEAQGVPNASVN